MKIRAHGIQHVRGVAAGFTATHSFHAPSATACSLQWDLGPRQASPHPERDYTRRRRLEFTATSSVYLATDAALVGAQQNSVQQPAERAAARLRPIQRRTAVQLTTK